ncbi:hypothetical protein DENSPDRAFT_842067 [Dentipellis sp. KUC8613]|nr:hypothetical protein DENSPDRAFT_842067 [Dentipellis sp. KUC8613]
MNVPLPLDLLFPSSVVDLRLRAASDSDIIFRCTRGHILALLDRLPRLQVLELDNTIHHLSLESTESDHLVSLPLLQSLRVIAGASDSMWLVQHLSLRSLADLHITVAQESFSPKAICTAIRPAFAAFTQAHHLDPLQALHVRTSSNRLDIAGWNTLDCFENRYVPPNKETSVFEFVLTGPLLHVDMDVQAVILEETFGSLDIRGVKKLRHWSEKEYGETWLDRSSILESLSAVEDVCICDDSLARMAPTSVRRPLPFVDYLSRSVTRLPYDTTFFPSLRRIHLVEVYSEESFDALLFALKQRKHQRGVRTVEEVEFEGCQLGLSVIEQFNEVVEKVIHDMYFGAEVELG